MGRGRKKPPFRSSRSLAARSKSREWKIKHVPGNASRPGGRLKSRGKLAVSRGVLREIVVDHEESAFHYTDSILRSTPPRKGSDTASRRDIRGRRHHGGVAHCAVFFQGLHHGKRALRTSARCHVNHSGRPCLSLIDDGVEPRSRSFPVCRSPMISSAVLARSGSCRRCLMPGLKRFLLRTGAAVLRRLEFDRAGVFCRGDRPFAIQGRRAGRRIRPKSRLTDGNARDLPVTFDDVAFINSRDLRRKGPRRHWILSQVQWRSQARPGKLKKLLRPCNRRGRRWRNTVADGQMTRWTPL